MPKIKKGKVPKEVPYNMFFWITETQVNTLQEIAKKNGRSLRKEIVTRVHNALEAAEIPDQPAEMLKKLQIQIPTSSVEKIALLAKHELLSARRKLTQIVIESLNQ